MNKIWKFWSGTHERLAKKLFLVTESQPEETKAGLITSQTSPEFL